MKVKWGRKAVRPCYQVVIGLLEEGGALSFPCNEAWVQWEGLEAMHVHGWYQEVKLFVGMQLE